MPTPGLTLLVARGALAAACLLATLDTTGCGSAEPPRPPPPGYLGPYPSPAAQSALKSLAGKTLAGSRLAPDGADLLFESFAVVPNPITGKGPVASFTGIGGATSSVRYGAAQGEGGRYWLPVLTDGDAADLVERLTGAKPTGFAGETSPTYRATLGL